jgi:hypothetical protein
MPKGHEEQICPVCWLHEVVRTTVNFVLQNRIFSQKHHIKNEVRKDMHDIDCWEKGKKDEKERLNRRIWENQHHLF